VAKIRGFKPDIWTDEDFVEVSAFARLLWLGMWNYCCDNGHIQDRSKQIKMRVLPTDDVNCADLLRELADQGLIRRADGWITVPNLTKHQRPDKRYWQTCEKPGCGHPSKNPEPETRSAPHETTPGARSGHDVVSQCPPGDGDGDGDGELMVITALPASAGKKQARRATQRPSNFRPGQPHIDLAAERGVDIRAEWAKFCDWSDANGKTYKDWPAALRNWIRNARPTLAATNGQPSRVQQHLALARQLAQDENRTEIGDSR